MGCPGNTGIDVGFGDKDKNSLDAFMSGKKKKSIFKRWYTILLMLLIIALATYFFIK